MPKKFLRTVRLLLSLGSLSCGVALPQHTQAMTDENEIESAPSRSISGIIEIDVGEGLDRPRVTRTRWCACCGLALPCCKSCSPAHFGSVFACIGVTAVGTFVPMCLGESAYFVSPILFTAGCVASTGCLLVPIVKVRKRGSRKSKD